MRERRPSIRRGLPTRSRCSVANVLVTGAAGWIGSHLVRQLTSRGHRVFALVRPGQDRWRLHGVTPLQIVDGDLESDSDVERVVPFVQPEICFHLAWYATPGKYLDAPENDRSVRASVKLVERLMSVGCGRVIVTGTCLEYGCSERRLSEDSPTVPESRYAAAKLELLNTLARLKGIRTTWARLFYQYGPMEDPRRIVPTAIQALLRGEPLDVSPAEQRRDFLHVTDVASALVSAGGLEGIVNIGSGTAVSLAEVFRSLEGIVGRSGLIRLGARPYEKDVVMSSWADNRRLVSTGWRPAYTLHEGLKDAVAWWRDGELRRSLQR